jgi:hypothetical protein
MYQASAFIFCMTPTINDLSFFELHFSTLSKISYRLAFLL